MIHFYRRHSFRYLVRNIGTYHILATKKLNNMVHVYFLYQDQVNISSCCKNAVLVWNALILTSFSKGLTFIRTKNGKSMQSKSYNIRTLCFSPVKSNLKFSKSGNIKKRLWKVCQLELQWVLSKFVILIQLYLITLMLW